VTCDKLKKDISLKLFSVFTKNEQMNEWMNEKKISIAHLKAYKCMLNLPRLAEN